MEEQNYLQDVLSTIDEGIENVDEMIDVSLRKIDYIQSNFQDEYYGMDDEEIASHKQIINDEDERVDNLEKIKSKLEKQRKNPYFARIDFLPDDLNQAQKVYIGMGLVMKNNSPMVCDWRAPISSLYYDFDKGRANYISPDGKIDGEIELKRQYKIEDSCLKYYFNSDIKIDDDILQNELANLTSNKMKNIVATIQKEQNYIIRNEDFENIMVQGNAGSGKTSIALHRVAYLLYKYRGTLLADDILIISPNNVFSSYISNVLPEMSEDNINEMSYQNFLKSELDGIEFSSYDEMLESILMGKDDRVGVVSYKESFEFAESLQKYLDIFSSCCFKAKNIKVGEMVFEASLLEKLFYESYAEKKPYLKVDWICDYILDRLEMTQSKQELVKGRLIQNLYSMFSSCDIVSIYKDFLSEIGIEFDENNIGYEDATPLMFIKSYIYGLKTKLKYKHLLIDEMQDYSPLSFMLFKEVFKCRKTILGDINQTVYKTLDKGYLEKICSIIENCKLIEISKSYRSTKQINEFAQAVKGISYQSVRNDGEEVSIIKPNDFKNDLVSQINILKQKYNTIAIITPTKKLCEKLFMILGEIDNLNYVDGTSDKLDQINLMPLSYSKGLEFDAVVVVMSTPRNNIEKNVMYLSSTRALHKLVIFDY